MASAAHKCDVALLLLLLLGSCAGRPPAGPTTSLAAGARIWAVHDGEKVDQLDLANPAARGNTAWDGHTVKLFGARNEMIAFQVIVQAADVGMRDVSVSLRELRQRGGEGLITYAAPAADPTNYVGRPIQMFVQHYMEVERVSDAQWRIPTRLRDSLKNPTGMKPVQLVPENAVKGGAPTDIEPRQNQGFWFDLYLHRDLPAGMYDGVVQVQSGRADRATLRELPVVLEVFDFALPEQPTLRAMIYFESEQVELYQGRNLDGEYHRFGHRNRVELVNEYDAASLEKYFGRFDGSDFTAARGYEGPGAGAGNKIVPATFYGPGKKYDERKSAWQTADAWMKLLAARVPDALTFVYLPDEPNPDKFPYIRQLAGNIKSNPGPGKALPVLITSPYRAELDDAIDIWCSPSSFYDLERARTERARGKRFWFYNGGRPQTGAIVLETPAADARMIGWAAYKAETDVYFFWHSNHWKHNSQRPRDRQQNVWIDPVTFDNRDQPGRGPEDRGSANGDGVLFYPGEEKLHPEEDRGVPGPISTVHFANLRRGLQDHIYLTMAKDRGHGALVERALEKIVPRVFIEALDRIGFPEQGDPYEHQRYLLAQAIAGGAARN